MIKLNDKPIKLNGYYLMFYATKYQVDDSLAIVCMTVDEEPYVTITVNLSDYGMIPEDNCIFINHDIMNTTLLNVFLNEFCTTNQIPIEYGFARSLYVELNEKTIDKINKGE